MAEPNSAPDKSTPAKVIRELAMTCFAVLNEERRMRDSVKRQDKIGLCFKKTSPG